VRRTDQRRAAVFACYQRELTGAPVDELLERGVLIPPRDEPERERPAAPASEYTRELLGGVDAKREELDRLIGEQAIGWELDRIAPLERCIMRVALYEILHRPDVPNEVAIDEAVETAKLYCGVEAPAFVNGILGGVMKRFELEPGGRRT
jgi:transcription antitermination protein NusB